MIDFLGLWYLYCLHMPLSLLKIELGKADIRMDAERKKAHIGAKTGVYAGNTAGSD